MSGGGDQQAFDLDLSAEIESMPADEAPPRSTEEQPESGRIVRVLPDVSGLDRTFDYLVSGGSADSVAVGSMVRVDLHGRRVAGWVTEIDVTPPPGVVVRPISKLSGLGPPAELVELAEWAAQRWAGRRARLMIAASPPTMVARLGRSRPAEPAPRPLDQLADAAFGAPLSLVRLPPTADPFPFVIAACARGNALIVTPTNDMARQLTLRVRRAGIRVALAPRDWAVGASGATVVGARGAAWMPVAELAAVLVIDEHDEALQEERTPTWNARDVAIERARRAGVPCVLTSPSPSLESLGLAEPMTMSRRVERDGWPIVEIIDRRAEEPGRSGLYSERLVAALRGASGPVVCVLNRTGRSRLLACDTCGEMTVCEHCGRAMATHDEGTLECVGCERDRPAVCLSCGGTRLKNLRVGVTRAREELEALAGRPVLEVTAKLLAPRELTDSSIIVGTEAVLHQVDHVELVAFLDFDQELLAPRYRAGEESMGLLIRAARLVGPRSRGGRLLVQTRQPRHEVLDAAVRADPGRFAAIDRDRRRLLSLPPFVAMAEVSGAAADAFVDNIEQTDGVAVLGPSDQRWLVRAPDHDRLSMALAAAERPAGRLRVVVDPRRV